ncbi:MAG: hypothetical protein WCJ56_01345 [bacterium]
MINNIVKHWSWPFIVSVGINILVLLVFTRLTIFAVEPQERFVVLIYLPEEMLAEMTPPPPPPPVVKKKKVIPPPDLEIPKLDDLAYDLLKEKPKEQHSKAQKIEKVEPNGATPEPTAGMSGSDNPAVGESSPGGLNEEWKSLLSNQPSGKPTTLQQPQQDMSRYSRYRDINTSLTDPAKPAGGSGGIASSADIDFSSDFITSPSGNPNIKLPGSVGGGGISGIRNIGRNRYTPDNGDNGQYPGNGKGPGNLNDSTTPTGSTGSAPTPGGSLDGPGGNNYGNSDGYPGGGFLQGLLDTLFGPGGKNHQGNSGSGIDSIGNNPSGVARNSNNPSNAPGVGNNPTSSGRYSPQPGLGTGSSSDGLPGSNPGAPKIIKWTDDYPSVAYDQNVQGDIGISVTFDTRGKPLRNVLYSSINEKGDTDIRVNRLLGQAVRDKVMKEKLQSDEIPTLAGVPMERTIYYRFQFRIK